jgi:hypothetical protein
MPFLPRTLRSCRVAPLLAALCALPLLSGSAFGWGCEGHQTIALIARAHLTPEAAAAVDSLLSNNPIDAAISRYCKDRPADLMADSASWADDVRNTEKTGPWHYIDIPLAYVQTATADVMEWCPPIGPAVDGKDRSGCVVDAIQYEWTILRQNATQAPTRTKALRYVIHFVEDVHMPLHTTTNNDNGGNCAVINFFSETPATNLHSIWDTKLIQHQLAAKNLTQQQYAADIDRRFAARWSDWGTSKAGIAEWVWEGHRLAAQVTYGDLKPMIPVEDPDEPTDCNAEKAKTAALKITVGQAYFDQSIPVVEEQMAKAGYRLAAMLNQTFAPKQ